LNAYGDKPEWFSRKVDGGKLPAIELDGELHIESQDIMELVEAKFNDVHDNNKMNTKCLIPSNQKERINSLFQLEAELQSAWFSLVFYPVEGQAFETAKENLIHTLQRVDTAVSATPGPWFLHVPEGHPTVVDIQFVATMERLIASVCKFSSTILFLTTS